MKRSNAQHQRGGILFEVMVGIALFVGSAAFTLAAMRNASDRIEQLQQQQQAVDLAASLMAELEAGRVSLADLREGLPRSLGSFENFEALNEDPQTQNSRWEVEVRTQQTQWQGLSLVEITVAEQTPAGAEDAALVVDRSVASHTLRQLVRLREDDPEAFEPDEIMDDLPDAELDGGQQ